MKTLTLVPLLLFCSFTLAHAQTPPLDAAPTDAALVDGQAAAPGSGSADVVIVVDVDKGTVTPGAGTPAAKVQADPIGTAKTALDDARAGHWRLLFASILAAIMVLGIKFAPGLFGKTDRGKAIMVMVLAVLGTLSAALAASSALSLSLISGAVVLAFTAVGGRAWISRLLWPADGGKRYLTWLAPILGVTLK